MLTDTHSPSLPAVEPHKPSTGQRILKTAIQGVIVLLFALAITWLCRLLLTSVFDLTLNNTYWVRDYLGNLVVMLLAFALVRNLNRALLLMSIVVVAFQLANGAKLSVLGTPLSPDDFFNAQNLIYLTEGWRRILLVLIASLPLVCIVMLIPFRQASTWVVMAALALAVMLVKHNSEPLRVFLDTQFGHSVWNQPENFKTRGLALHIVQESIRTSSKIGKHPNEVRVNAAIEHLHANPHENDLAPTNAHPLTTTTDLQRNLHIIVLESFFDPMTLGPEWVPEDPFPASFRALWNATNHSKVLSPVFGGYTANAEFEALCGFPVIEDAVFFEGWLRRDVPCLPSILADAGYRTIASHPNVPGFWNRTHAYQLIGFNDYWSKADFDLSDSVQGVLLDHSLYDQVFDKLSEQETTNPIMNYMLTYHGHLPYPGSTRYPDKLQAGRDSPLLQGYLNQLWYKSRDLMTQLETLRMEDPNALIVVFGDHLPFLGKNYGVYKEALNLPENRANYTPDMQEFLVSTPLIVIDGTLGPLELGTLPLYRLPALILSLLGHQSDASILNWSRNPTHSRIRPINGRHITHTDNGTKACMINSSTTEVCRESADWLLHLGVLTNDLFSGHQYSLQPLTR